MDTLPVRPAPATRLLFLLPSGTRFKHAGSLATFQKLSNCLGGCVCRSETSNRLSNLYRFLMVEPIAAK